MEPKSRKVFGFLSFFSKYKKKLLDTGLDAVKLPRNYSIKQMNL